jgi:hypothetical protein
MDELENITLSEANQAQKAKGHVFSLICGTEAQYKYKQYYQKQVMLRGGHYQEREGKRQKLRRWIWLMYFLYKNEYTIFKPVEITTRRGLSREEKNRGDEPIWVIIHIYMELS